MREIKLRSTNSGQKIEAYVMSGLDPCGTRNSDGCLKWHWTGGDYGE